MNSIVIIILSLVPFVLVGAWLIHRVTKSNRSLLKKSIKVGDQKYIATKVSRILALEKKTGRDAIVTTCGFESEQMKIEGELTNLPEGVKVHYKLENGVFSPEESDWFAGEDFKVIGVTQVEEYIKV